LTGESTGERLNRTGRGNPEGKGTDGRPSGSRGELNLETGFIPVETPMNCQGPKGKKDDLRDTVGKEKKNPGNETKTPDAPDPNFS